MSEASISSPYGASNASALSLAAGSDFRKPRITILPATSAAFPALATADLLAFSGASGEPASRLISPLRRDLVRSGAHPRHWPDFQASIDSLQKGVREGKVMVMAVVEDAGAPVPTVGRTILYGRGEQSKGTVTINGVTGVAAGLVKLCPPAHVRRALLSSRNTSDRLWDDYVSPVTKKLRQVVYGEDATGTNLKFLSLFKGEMERVRKEKTSDDDWLLELLFVHPAYQGCGVARALLQHCQELAVSVDPLAFPYPSPYSTLQVGLPLNVSTNSSASPFSTNSPLKSELSSENPNSQVTELRKVRMFVEASQAGTPVYTRLGFRPIYKSSIEYEGEQISWPVMLWEGYVLG